MRLSVIIPTLNEAAALPVLLEDLRPIGSLPGEIVVVDAGSSDDTVGLARAQGASIVTALRGRARQLNAGARRSQGDWLLFLHADSRVGPEAQSAIRQVLAGILPADAAVFRFSIDLPPVWKRLIEAGQTVRELLFGLSYGDQGLLVRRDCFEAVGGYPELPLMEDVAMIRRLRWRYGIRRLAAPLVTSGRRYRERGTVRTWLLHSLLITLFAAGISPTRLARWRESTGALAR